MTLYSTVIGMSGEWENSIWEIRHPPAPFSKDPDCLGKLLGWLIDGKLDKNQGRVVLPFKRLDSGKYLIQTVEGDPMLFELFNESVE